MATFRSGYEDDVSNVALRPHFSDQVTKMMFRALPFVGSFRSGYEDDVSTVSPLLSPSDSITKMTFRALALCRSFVLCLHGANLTFMNSFDAKC